MKIFFIVTSFFFCNYLFAQSAFETKYSKDVCSCLDNLKNARDSANYMDCFQKAFHDDRELVIQEFQRIYADDTSSENALKFAKDLRIETSIILIKECNIFFVLTDSLRYEKYKNLNSDSLKNYLRKLNKIESSRRNDQYYSDKAMLFFQLKMLDSSLIEIRKSLNVNPKNIESLYLEGWISEIKGNYDVAISLYNEVAELTHMKSFYIFSEIAKRKKNGI
jgi:tetratricopeptide (TPR) repeat protein